MSGKFERAIMPGAASNEAREIYEGTPRALSIIKQMMGETRGSDAVSVGVRAALDKLAKRMTPSQVEARSVAQRR